MGYQNIIKRFLTNLFILLLTVILLFMVGEVSLRIYHYFKYPGKVPEAVLEFHLDDRLGWRATENYRFKGILNDADMKPYHVEMETNQYGFRVFGNLNSPKKKIMVIGDSLTQASAVSNSKTYYGIINQTLPVEVFAYGCGGYGTLQEYLILDEYVDMIKPDIIIWQFCTNDFINNDYELELNSTRNNNGTRRPYLSSDGKIIYAVPTRYKTISFIREHVNPHSKLSAFIFKRVDRLLARYTKDITVENDIASQGADHPGFKRAARLTNKLMQMVRQRTPNTRIIVFCGDGGLPFYEEVKKISAQNHMEFIDGIPQAIREANKPGNTTYAEDKAHWNELGHKIVAEKISEYLTKSKIIN
jgi:lysophospholipase L1-like esterase